MKSYWFVTFSAKGGFCTSALEMPGFIFKPIDAMEYICKRGGFKFTEIGIYYHKRISKSEFIKFQKLSNKKL